MAPKVSLIGYSKGGYVLGFYTDPDDMKGTMDSVSPEKIFGEEKDNFSSLPSQNDLVKDTSQYFLIMKKLDNKVAIITGGAGGIGKATAIEFLNEGSDVLLFDLNESDLKDLCQEIGSNHLSYYAGDVTSFEDNLKAVEIAQEKFGGLDIFVANAGIEGD